MTPFLLQCDRCDFAASARASLNFHKKKKHEKVDYASDNPEGADEQKEVGKPKNLSQRQRKMISNRDKPKQYASPCQDQDQDCDGATKLEGAARTFYRCNKCEEVECYEKKEIERHIRRRHNN